MKAHLALFAAAMLWSAPNLVLAQTEQHHPTENATEAPPASDQIQMMRMMMQNCMGMMQMMQDMPMMQDMQGGVCENMPMQGGGQMPMPGSEATMAFMTAMSKMDAPMMQAIKDPNPEVAFVKAMIPHHQSAIDMARAVLQYGRDEQVKAWVNQIIAAQEMEIAEMQEWLTAHGQ